MSFCSGKKMTAKDVVATYERWLDPETKGLVKWRMGDVDKVTAPDDYTVEYKLKKPFSELLYQMTQYFHTILNVEQAKQLGADFGVKGDRRHRAVLLRELDAARFDGAHQAQGLQVGALLLRGDRGPVSTR